MYTASPLPGDRSWRAAKNWPPSSAKVSLPITPFAAGLVTGHFKADSHIACRAHAAPLPCRALIHTCHAALPCSDSAVSFVNVRMVAGNIRDASPQCNIVFFCSVLLPLFIRSMTDGVWFHTGHLHLRLVCV